MDEAQKMLGMDKSYEDKRPKIPPTDAAFYRCPPMPKHKITGERLDGGEWGGDGTYEGINKF